MVVVATTTMPTTWAANQAPKARTKGWSLSAWAMPAASRPARAQAKNVAEVAMPPSRIQLRRSRVSGTR